MIRLLQWLFVGHFHKWKTAQTGSLIKQIGERGERYIQQGERCGVVKKRDLI